MDAPPTQSSTTDQLVEACLQGNQRAWNTLVRRYWRRVFNVAYKFVGKHDEAEDLTQEIFLRVFKALGTFDRRANFQTWLISISRNLCIDHYRSVRKEREIVDRSVDAGDVPAAAQGPDPLARLQRLDRLEFLLRAMVKLPPALREAVLLRDIQELSYQEIAHRLQLPDGTVKSRLNRGRRALARQIAMLEREQSAMVGSRTTTPHVTASGAGQ